MQHLGQAQTGSLKRCSRFTLLALVVILSVCLPCINSAFAADCNMNAVEDAIDISGGTSIDANGNTVPDECDLRGDFDGNGIVDPFDYTGFNGCLTAPSGPGVGVEVDVAAVEAFTVERYVLPVG